MMKLAVNAVKRDATVLRESVKRAFSDVRGELDEHREGINANAAEIRANFDHLCAIEAKLEKLAERIDELTTLFAPEKDDFSSIKLSRQEQELFLALSELEGPVTAEQVGRKAGLSSRLAAQYLYNLQLKGVPIIARAFNDELFYSLDLKFKDLQSRKNVLRINA